MHKACKVFDAISMARPLPVRDITGETAYNVRKEFKLLINLNEQ